MAKADRRAKVTPETKEESKRLAELWATRSHPTQAEFGDTYGIGNQSAVGQFLRGETPLSLKAARGFAQGLGCRIADFSPRLAAEAAAIANMVPGDSLSADVAAVAGRIDKLPAKQRAWLLDIIEQSFEALESVQRPTPPNGPPTQMPEAANGVLPTSAKRRSNG